MSELDRLANQHILESESHLRYIDEMMAKARAAQAQQKLDASTLSRLEQEHGQAAQTLQALGSRPRPATAEVVAQSEGVKGVLQKIGLELEKALTAIGDQSGMGGNKSGT